MNYSREEIISAAQFVEIDEDQLKAMFKKMDALKIKRKKKKDTYSKPKVMTPELFASWGEVIKRI